MSDSHTPPPGGTPPEPQQSPPPGGPLIQKHPDPPPGNPRLTGARPTPRVKLAASFPFRPLYAPPPQSAFVPAQLSMWGNDRYGDCVTAEEAFAKACYSPEIFVPEQTVIAWAQRNGWLNGADLLEVMQMMQRSGFVIGSQTYNDGTPATVDFSSESILQAALSQGPVKIGIDASALPQGAGSQQGWHATGGRPGEYRNEDHSVSLAGYGPAAWLYQQLGVQVPSGLAANTPGYLLFTWSTLGFVDHAWIMSTCGEAWLRQPTTLGVPPLPAPTPPPPPPGPPPGPGPASAGFSLLLHSTDGSEWDLSLTPLTQRRGGR